MKARLLMWPVGLKSCCLYCIKRKEYGGRGRNGGLISQREVQHRQAGRSRSLPQTHMLGVQGLG